MMQLPMVSIVVTAYNEEKDIKDMLNSLMKLDYPKKRLEIIVVDDGSTDKTPEILKKYPVKVIMGPHKGFGHARNIGWKRATGEIIVFIDADMVIDKKYIIEVVKYLQENKDFVAVEGKELLYTKKNLLARMHHLRHVLGEVQAKHLIPRVYRKEILGLFNGFDEDFGYYIDWELNRRVLNKGLKTGHTKKAIIYNKPVENFRELFNQCRWNGRSIVFAFKKYKLHAVKRIVFVLLNALVPLYLILLLLPMPFKILGIMGLLIFSVIEGIRSVKMFLITKWWESFLTPIYDIVSMILIAYGMVDRFVSNLKKPVG